MTPFTTSSIQLLQHDFQGLTVCIAHRSPVIVQIRLNHLTALSSRLGIFRRFILLADNVVQQCCVVIRHFFWCTPVWKQTIIRDKNNAIRSYSLLKVCAAFVCPFVVGSAYVSCSRSIIVVPLLVCTREIVAILNSFNIRINKIEPFLPVSFKDMGKRKLNPAFFVFSFKLASQLLTPISINRVPNTTNKPRSFISTSGTVHSFSIQPNTVPIVERSVTNATFVSSFKLWKRVLMLPEPPRSIHVKECCPHRFSCHCIQRWNFCISGQTHQQDSQNGKR